MALWILDFRYSIFIYSQRMVKEGKIQYYTEISLSVMLSKLWSVWFLLYVWSTLQEKTPDFSNHLPSTMFTPDSTANFLVYLNML